MPEEVLARFRELGRDYSTTTVLYHSRIAEQMGLSGTDHKCLDFVVRAGKPLTAGQIAQLSGLSTGAVTGVIDRLERGGFVRRVPDRGDRRKVLVEVTDFDEHQYAHLFVKAEAAAEAVLSRFTPDEWDVIERYMRAVMEEFGGPAHP